MPYEREKQVAVEAALSAAKLCEQVRQEMGPEAMEKKDGTPVTVADFGSQALICRTIADAFPGDQVVGEEEGTPLRDPDMGAALKEVTAYVQRAVFDATQEDVISWINQGNGEVGPRYWAIDPIDGTKGFLRGDHYAVAIALVEGGEVKLGIMACPSLHIHPGNYEGKRGVLFVGFQPSRRRPGILQRSRCQGDEPVYPEYAGRAGGNHRQVLLLSPSYRRDC